MFPLLVVAAFLAFPQIPLAHANPFTGTVCIEDFTSVPQTNPIPCNHVLSGTTPVGPTFDGPNLLPNHQIQIGLYVNGSDPLNGWDITLKVDHTLLVPAYRSSLVVDPTHSLVGPENINGASLSVVALCVQGISVVGNCLSTDTIDTLHYSVVGGKTVANPSGGLLFTALYNITGKTPSAGIPIGYQTNCAGSVSVPGQCVTILTGTPNPAPETSMTATFNNSGTTAPGVCVLAPCTGVPYVTVSSSTTSLTLLAGKSGSVTLTATAQSGWPGNAVPPGASNDLVTFTETASTGLIVGLAAGTTCATGGASCSSPSVSVSATATGNYFVTFFANYVANSYVNGQNNTLAAPVTVTVRVTDYSWSVTPTTVNIPKGTSPTVMTGTLTSLNGFSGTVFFQAIASPATGLATTFTPTSVPLASGGTATVNISFSATVENRFSDTLRACTTSTCLTTGLIRNAITSVFVNGFNITDTAPTHTVTFTTTAGSGSDSIRVQSLPAGSVNGYGAAGSSGLVTFTTSVSPSTGLTATCTSLTVPAGGTITGTSNCTFTSMAANTYTVTITGAGGTNGLITNSTIVTVMVTGGVASPTIATSLSNASPVVGSPVTDSATISGGSTSGVTGTVTYNLFANAACTVPGSPVSTVTVTGGVVPNSRAVLFNSTGSFGFNAVYSGDANNNRATSACEPLTVQKASTTTIVASSVNPSVFGQSVIFTATVTVVSPGAGSPSGTVNFLDGATMIGSGTLSSTAPFRATFTTSTLAVGAHSITASYAGNANFNGSTSAVLTQTANKAGTSTSVASSLNPSTFGQSVTFTATVTVVAPGAGSPSGTVTFLDGTTTLGTGTLSSGTATFTTSALAVGSHSITASYGGDASFNGSTSAVLTQTVNPVTGVTIATTIRDSTNAAVTSIVLGATVHDSATLTGQTATAGGSVSYSFWNTGTCSGTRTAAGTVTVTNGVVPNSNTITPTAASSFSFNATYSGDANNNRATSGCELLTVTRASTTTTVVSSANPSVFGQSVTFTATVTGSTTVATLTGTVTFLDGTTTLGTGTVSGGIATFATSTLAVGSHSITASYGGDTNFTGSTSAVLTQTVNKASTTTTVASSANPSVFGQSVTFTATVAPVAPGAGSPSGTVTFLDGTTTLGTGTLSAGTATFTTSTLAVGSHPITASYGGDANFSGSSSAVLTQTVNPVTGVSIATTIRDSTNAAVTSVALGTAVHDSATLTGQTATAGGSVSYSFWNTGTCSGTRTAAGTVTVTNGVVPNSNTITPTAASSFSFNATYSGDANNNRATSACELLTVTKAASTTTVTSSASPSVFGQSVTFTATVTVVAPGAGSPSGTVTFFDGTTTLGTGTLSGGTATFTTSTLAVGSHSITASYGGDANFNGSTSAVLTQVVNPVTGVSISTTIQNSANVAVTSVVLGTAVHDTATLSGQTATAGGTVAYSFWNTGTCTGTRTAAGTVTVTNGVVPNSNAFTPTTVGSYSFNATYSGDANNNRATSGCELLTVTRASTTTTVVSSANPSVFGQSVTFTATVTGSTTVATLTGTVTFLDGATTLGTGTLSGGTATFTTSALAVGSHSITASYGGDTNFTGSTSVPLTQTVGPAAAVTISTIINDSTNTPASSIVIGAAVHDTATLSGVTATAGGTVTYQFFTGSSCSGTGTTVGTPVTVTNGIVPGSAPQIFNNAGSFSWNAVYSGDSNNSAATSACEPLAVTKAGPTITTNLSASVITIGGSATDSATLTHSFQAGGTVAYNLFNSAACTGTPTLVSTVTVTGGAVPTSGSQTFPIAGTFGWNAVYSGDANNSPATSACEPFTVITTTGNPILLTFNGRDIDDFENGIGQLQVLVNGHLVVDIPAGLNHLSGSGDYAPYDDKWIVFGPFDITSFVVQGQNTVLFRDPQTADHFGLIRNVTIVQGDTVLLQVPRARGIYPGFSVTYTFSNPPLVLTGFTVSNSTPAAGQNVTFTATYTGGTGPFKCIFLFGDGRSTIVSGVAGVCSTVHHYDDSDTSVDLDTFTARVIIIGSSTSDRVTGQLPIALAEDPNNP